MSLYGHGALNIIDVDLVVNTAQYADADLLSDKVEVEGVFNPNHHTALIQSLHILDDGDQGAALDILFFTASATLGTINAALNASDGVLSKLVGVVEVAAGDYVDLINAQYAIPQFNPFVIRADDSDKTEQSLWIAAVSRGTPTYTGTDDLHVRIGLLR